MIKIGITGGIGSGKSVVCDIFRLHGVPVFDADMEAKKLNDSSPLIREKLSLHFGEELYAEGYLNRKKLAEIIFNNEKNLKIANSIIHPELANHFLLWAWQRESFPLLALDAAILFEADFRKYVDKVITVVAPTAVRIDRVQKRDGVEKSKIEARMSNQLTDEEKMKRSDFIIYNDNNQSLIKQVNRILKKCEIQY